MSNYPPRDYWPIDVDFWDYHGMPISVGPIPGCLWHVAVWGRGAPQRWREQKIELDNPPAIGAKLVSADEFRQLITIALAGY